jgi:hypothetical protein
VIIWYDVVGVDYLYAKGEYDGSEIHCCVVVGCLGRFGSC